jgi:ATP-grasp ribosomal peptide maturase
MTVLILAREFDPTVDAVVHALNDYDVAVFRTDLAHFPRGLRLDVRLRSGRWIGELCNDDHSVALENIRAIWSRNPNSYRFDESLSQQEREFCHREAKLGLGGVLAALDVLWANHPNRCADAIFKPYQWKIAVECGLQVADTAVTNSPAAAVRFIGADPGDTITKALGPTGITIDDSVKITYTRRLTPDDLAEPGCLTATATTLQRYVPKAYEVRLTVIGIHVFPVAIRAVDRPAPIDRRAEPETLHYELIEAPEPVLRAVRRYMRRMNLTYAGFDFVITPDDEWVMLEANTGPQWAWLEAATGAPMVAAMASTLAAGIR